LWLNVTAINNYKPQEREELSLGVEQNWFRFQPFREKPLDNKK
jgi:hypothetical protein